MGTSLRIYPSQAKHLLDNYGSHWTGTVYAEMDLLLLMHPSFEEWKEQHDHAESLGVHSVPSLRLGPATFADWFSRAHWDNVARDLLTLTPERQGNDPRICFDAELYLDNRQEPTETNSVSHGGLSALEQAMQLFLDVIDNEGIKPAIHPIGPAHLVPKLLLQRANSGEIQDEYTFGRAAAHRQDYPKWATTIPDSSARQLALLAAFPEADTYVSGFHDECLRNWQMRFRNDWHVYGERRWIFLQNRQNENRYLGTEEWLSGTTLNSLNDAQYVWNFSGPNALVDLINDQPTERYWVSPSGHEVQGHGPPLNIAPVYKGVFPYDQTNNAFNTRLNFIGTQNLRWHPHALGEPPLAFLATNVKLHKGQADKCLLSVWVDGGHYAYRVRWDHGQDRWCLDLHTTNSLTTIRSTTATPEIEHEVYAFFGNGNAGIAVEGAVTSQAWTGNLQWANGPFRIGGAGRGTVQWTDFAGCSLEKLTVWKGIPNGIPSGGFPWAS